MSPDEIIPILDQLLQSGQIDQATYDQVLAEIGGGAQGGDPAAGGGDPGAAGMDPSMMGGAEEKMASAILKDLIPAVEPAK